MLTSFQYVVVVKYFDVFMFMFFKVTIVIIEALT